MTPPKTLTHVAIGATYDPPTDQWLPRFNSKWRTEQGDEKTISGVGPRQPTWPHAIQTATQMADAAVHANLDIRHHANHND